MSDADDRREEDPFATVREVLANPSEAIGTIPALLELLESEASTVRLAGAFGLCLVASANPESVPSIAARLADRLESDGRAEAMVAYDYLASQFPRHVDAAIRGDAEDDGAPAGPSSGPGDGTAGRDDVGRVRPPGVGSYDPRTVTPDPDVIDPADPQRHAKEETSDRRSGGLESGGDDGDGSTPSRFRTDASERQQWNRLYERLSTIVGHSRFDDLMVLSGRSRERYADVSRVLAVEGNVERALALRLFHRPEESGSFLTDLEDALSQWEAIADHPHVVSVFDTGRQPQPWAATDPIVETLADRAGHFEPTAAASLAGDLADALAYAHQHGVIHGGLDPRNVALGATDGETPRTGSLDNPMLLSVYRWYVTPVTCLDPRYAAPEYYDRRFGRVDHATDIYHLGAVLYRLLTGRPPFDGPFEEIRESVMQDAPPDPSAVADLPASLDRIVTKALGKHTLERYETINDLRGDLDRVHEELTADGG